MQPNFQKFLSRKHSVLTDDILITAWNDQARFIKIANFSDYVQNLEIIDGDFCFDINWFAEIQEKYKNADSQFFLDFIERGYLNGEKAKKYARKLKVGNNLQVLKKQFADSIELLKNLLVFLPETHPLAKIVENKITQFIKQKGILGNKINEVLLEISAPKKLNGPILEQKDLLAIKKKMNLPNFDLNKALKKHLAKYSYLGYREPFSKGYDQQFFKDRLATISYEHLKPKDKLKFSNEEKQWIKLMQEFVYFRNYRTEKLYEVLFYVEKLWLKLAQAFGLAGQDLGYYFLKEIDELFASSQKVNSQEIAKRKSGHGVLLYDNKIKFIFGQDLANKKQQLNRVDQDIDELTGMVACKGLARGKVKIVLQASDQAKVETGDIIVASMTTPDFLPSMKRAVAFVTDEGGITCHAAIVSRELGKPCIIGTKIATKVLKDGDRVEVDADKGIVRILK